MQNKKTKKTLNIILIIVGLSTFVFTAVMFVFFALFQTIPDTLCERFYTCVVGELGIAGCIQVVKTVCDVKRPQNTHTEEYSSEEYPNDEELNEGENCDE